MNNQKQQKLNQWTGELAGFLHGTHNNGLHLVLKIGERMVDVWPTSGKYQVNKGPTMYSSSTGNLLASVEQLPDVPPADGWPTKTPPVPMPSSSMAMAVQFKTFEWSMGQRTVFEQANDYLAENAGSIQYVDFKLLQRLSEGGTDTMQDMLVLVYKILIE